MDVMSISMYSTPLRSRTIGASHKQRPGYRSQARLTPTGELNSSAKQQNGRPRSSSGAIAGAESCERLYFLGDPQRASVSATVTLDRPKKFISAGQAQSQSPQSK
ncbi:hypothetical protein AAVH_40812, partial [Aphelenchoides avenae]